jgi:hypothetical protein
MINTKEIALGKGLGSSGSAKTVEPITVEGRLKVLEEKLQAMTLAFYATRNALKQKQVIDEIEEEVFGDVPKNSDNIPLNTSFIGVTRSVPYLLIVNDLGEYVVGYKKYPSLSAAAEDISGTRRSGWTFWKLPDGRTAKEVFKD